MEKDKWYKRVFKWIAKNYETLMFYLFSLASSVFCFFIFFNNVSLGKISQAPMVLLISLLFGFFFLFLPFMKTVKIGSLVELKRNIQETKKDVDTFKHDVEQMLSIISTNINTMSNNSNTVNFSFPTLDEILSAQAKLTSSTDSKVLKESKEIKDELNISNPTRALVELRLRLERLLTELVKLKDNDFDSPSFGILIQKYVALYPDYEYLLKPIKLIYKTCSMAIHAKNTPIEDVDVVLNLGSSILAILTGKYIELELAAKKVQT